MRKLYLLRGVSGSGKSTLALELEGLYLNTDMLVTSVAADDYFDYFDLDFNTSLLEKAHEYCRGITESAMHYGEPVVIVHNTFTTEKEMQPYLDMAKEYGYEVVSLVVENRHGNTSVHSVPTHVLKRQESRLRGNLQLCATDKN